MNQQEKLEKRGLLKKGIKEEKHKIQKQEKHLKGREKRKEKNKVTGKPNFNIFLHTFV